MLGKYSNVEKMAMGRISEAEQFSKLQAEGTYFRDLKVRGLDANGKPLPGYTKLDAIGFNYDGTLGLFEFKLSVNSPYQPMQLLHYPNIVKNGFIIDGTLAGRTLPKGNVYPPTNINHIKKGPQ
jgi:hypothetical protein